MVQEGDSMMSDKFKSMKEGFTTVITPTMRELGFPKSVEIVSISLNENHPLELCLMSFQIFSGVEQHIIIRRENIDAVIDMLNIVKRDA